MSNNGAGKGDAPRPVNLKKYGQNYDSIFRKNKACSFDTDGDGDCHLCVEFGGCENYHEYIEQTRGMRHNRSAPKHSEEY